MTFLLMVVVVLVYIITVSRERVKIEWGDGIRNILWTAYFALDCGEYYSSAFENAN